MFRVLGFAAIAALTIAPAFAAGDAAKGAAVFARCAICHSNAKGAPNRIGPNLFGVVGRKAGTAPDFSYSGAMKSSGIIWTTDRLTAYVTHPQLVVPGNRMAFPGLSNQTQAADLVAYLGTLK
jgi:cytochrome c